MTSSDHDGAAATLRLEAVSFDVADPPAAAAFWAVLLDRRVVREPSSVFLPGDRTQVGLRFVGGERGPGGRPRLHLHLTSTSLEDQHRTADLAVRHGGRHLDVGQGADDRFVVLADPGGNELCVIEPGNHYLEGTGRLGEVTCNGSRAVGRFWRDALDWKLVWDQDQQTAIQSPFGGTKIAWDAWAGSPAGPTTQPTHQRFDLVSANPSREAERLIALGAIRRAHGTLADPDGNEFHLSAERS